MATGKTSDINRKVTDENRAEARRLRAIWDAAKARGAVSSQEKFGADYGIGGQAAVWQFLSGKTPLSAKAAAGFAEGLGCKVADFSPRLASLLRETETAGLRPEEQALLDSYRSLGELQRAQLLAFAAGLAAAAGSVLPTAGALRKPHRQAA